MVRILIALRATISRNQFARGSKAAIWAVVAFGLLSAAGTLALGITGNHNVDGSLDRVSAVLLLWLGGQLAQGALNGGDAALRPELLALLPLDRRRLARALLVVGLCDPALVIIAAACAAVIAVAAGLGAAAVTCSVLGVAGLLVLLWLRDPVRFTCLLIGLIVGVGAAVIPRVATGHSQLLPFSGPLTVVIIGACAANLYGNDGSSLWLTVTTPHAAAADVRGRQLALLLLVAPFTAVETVLLTAWSGQHALWPWALGLLIALLGGAAGLAPLASLISVQPLDEGGNPTPAWSLKVHIALIAVTLTAAPAVAVLILGGLSHTSAVCWLGVAVAVITAAGFTVLLGGAAARRLQARQVDVLRLLAA